MKNKFISIVLASLLSSNMIFANEEKNNNLQNESNKIVTLDSNDNATEANFDEGFNEETIDSWINDFENKLGIIIGQAEGGKTFFAGRSAVRVNPLDPAYPKELALAYDKAMLNLQANFILQTYGRMTTERITDEFNDDSTNAREFDKKEVEEAIKKGKINSILDKVLAIINNELDSKLQEQGVTPDKLGKLSITQKKLLYKDNFKKAMVKKAVQSISGLVPVQTKIITNTNGAVELGVIAVMSEKTVQFAKDISKARATNVEGKPKNLKDILPQNNNEYLNEFGLRYTYDSKGKPMLISYGRWSVVNSSKDPSKNLRKIQNAKEKARMFAESYIGEFMKSNIEASQGTIAESISEEIAEKVTEYDSTGITNESENTNDIGETIDKSFKNIKSKSKFKLRGTSQVKTWEAKDINGLTHVGSVITWTYDQLNNANNIASNKFKKDEEIKKENKEIKKENKTSKIINDVDDF